MVNAKVKSPRTRTGTRAQWAFLVFCVAWGLCFIELAKAQQPGEKTFSSAEQASQALFIAVQTNDQKALLAIFGPDGNDVISSGDTTEDHDDLTTFTQKYLEMHRLVTEPDGKTTLYIGAENWPAPIQLVNKNGAWYFDTDAGKQEILLRQIGENELETIQVCHTLVDAQKEYSAGPGSGKSGNQYAQKFASDEGQRDGLYWKEESGQPQSPVGPFVAQASGQGLAQGQNREHLPFHGYYFGILMSQAKGAPGGAKNYVADGKMTGGFAFVAYPADYRSSGVMTFIVNRDGIVYQKDLGPQTASVASGMSKYDPDSTWQKTE